MKILGSLCFSPSSFQTPLFSLQLSQQYLKLCMHMQHVKEYLCQKF